MKQKKEGNLPETFSALNTCYFFGALSVQTTFSIAIGSVIQILNP